MRVEDWLQEWQAAHKQQQCNGKTNRILHITIREQADLENGGALRANGIRSEKLTQGKRDKCHGFCSLHIHAAPVMLKQIGKWVSNGDSAYLKMPEQTQPKRCQYCTSLRNSLHTQT